MANLELYKIFIQVADEKNITRASEKLHISQPAVTRHIKNLENELNMVLFNRTNGMELTKAGRKLYSEISECVKKLTDVDRKYCCSNEILLGTYATMFSRVLSSSIAEFYSKNKDAKVTIITDNSKVLNNPLSEGDLDIAVLKKYDEKTYDSSKYKFVSLGNVDFYMIANKNSDLCNKKKIKITDLKNKIIYIPRGDNSSTKVFKDLVDKFSMENEVKRIDSISLSKIVQEYDNCIGIANSKYLTEELKQNKFCLLDIDFEIPPTEFGIYYRRENSSMELKELVKIIKKNFGNLGNGGKISRSSH